MAMLIGERRPATRKSPTATTKVRQSHKKSSHGSSLSLSPRQGILPIRKVRLVTSRNATRKGRALKVFATNRTFFIYYIWSALRVFETGYSLQKERGGVPEIHSQRLKWSNRSWVSNP